MDPKLLLNSLLCAYHVPGVILGTLMSVNESKPVSALSR